MQRCLDAKTQSLLQKLRNFVGHKRLNQLNPSPNFLSLLSFAKKILPLPVEARGSVTESGNNLFAKRTDANLFTLIHLFTAQKLAFTLAEVLITLGIIGIVAALTMPSLIQNHRKHEVETKLAKIYSMMNQATQMSNLEYGDITEWGTFSEYGFDQALSVEQVTELFKKYFGKHLKYTSIKPYENGEERVLVYFADGTILSITYFVRDMYVYINGKALENPKVGINVFRFRFAPGTIDSDVDNTAEINKYHLGKGFEPYAWRWNGKIDSLYEDNIGDLGCNQSGRYCTKLIQMNGWKIPKDYPLKF